MARREARLPVRVPLRAATTGRRYPCHQPAARGARRQSVPGRRHAGGIHVTTSAVADVADVGSPSHSSRCRSRRSGAADAPCPLRPCPASDEASGPTASRRPAPACAGALARPAALRRQAGPGRPGIGHRWHRCTPSRRATPGTAGRRWPCLSGAESLLEVELEGLEVPGPPLPRPAFAGSRGACGLRGLRGRMRGGGARGLGRGGAGWRGGQPCQALPLAGLRGLRFALRDTLRPCGLHVCSPTSLTLFDSLHPRPRPPQ